jgi:hypothetical protein
MLHTRTLWSSPPPPLPSSTIIVAVAIAILVISAAHGSRLPQVTAPQHIEPFTRPEETPFV